MEVNMVLFTAIIFITRYKDLNQEIFRNCLFYFFVQSLGSFLFVIRFLLSQYSFISRRLFGLSLILKIGLFPMHFWVFKFSLLLELVPFILFITWQKVPFFFIIFNFFSDFIFILLIINTFIGSIIIWISKSFKSLLVSSSIYSSFWIFILFFYSVNSIFFFFSVYSFFFLSLNYLGNKINFILDFRHLFYLLFLIFLLGLPPFRLFFYKIILSSVLIFEFRLIEILLFWISAFFSLFGYVKLLYRSFFSNFVHYINNEKIFFFKSFFYIRVPLTLVFLLYWSKLFKLSGSYLD